MDLSVFMAEHTGRPWSWRTCNCALVLADWVSAQPLRLDPAPGWRGRCDDEAAFKRIVQEAGGLLPIVRAVCERAGLSETAAPVRGAIGVIGSRHRFDRQWGAIHDGKRWHVRHPLGFVPVTAPTLGMWKV